MLLRQDGEKVFYQIEHWGNPGGNPNREDWVLSSFDSFGTPHSDFQASGECWQETGHHGTYDPITGVGALQKIAKDNPGYKFRLVRRRLKQETELIAQFSVHETLSNNL